jgi:hypothetical protein
MWFVCLIMQRTTVVLPVKDLARARAHSAGISFGEFVRRAVERAAARDPLLNDDAVFKGRVPKDLSARHDDYLYVDS